SCWNTALAAWQSSRTALPARCESTRSTPLRARCVSLRRYPDYTRSMHETTIRRRVQLDPDRLRLERQRQALTQEELAHRAGITRLAVSQLERGLVQPRLPTLRKLAEALGIKPASLLVNEGNS